MIKQKSYIFYSIFVFFILSLLLSLFFLSKYDVYQLDGSTHIMLKEETYAHWYKAALLLDQIKNGTSFFIAGEEVYTKPLPSRLVAIYLYLTNFNITNDFENIKIALGGKFLFLFVQSLVYYLSVFFFYNQIKNYLNLNVCFFITLFLCCEPTIFQYHSSFWTESFYFSIQLLLLSFLLIKTEKNFKYIVIGLLLGLLFLQRSAGIFYIIIIISYFLFNKDERSLKKIFLTLFSYLIICFILGMHNFKRAGVFYVMPTEGKYNMYKYFAKDVLAKKNETTTTAINKIEVKNSLIWIKNHLPKIDTKNLEEISSPYAIGTEIIDEKDRLKYYNYLNKRAYKILIKNPTITLKKVFSGVIHFSVLNPFFVYYDYEYFKDYSSSIIGDFFLSEEHQKIIPARIIYTLLIYSICFMGFFVLLKKNLKLTFLLFFSILYYYIVLGWYGKTRLFTPCLIYMSVFFGLGLENIINKIKPNKL